MVGICPGSFLMGLFVQRFNVFLGASEDGTLTIAGGPGSLFQIQGGTVDLEAARYSIQGTKPLASGIRLERFVAMSKTALIEGSFTSDTESRPSGEAGIELYWPQNADRFLIASSADDKLQLKRGQLVFNTCQETDVRLGGKDGEFISKGTSELAIQLESLTLDQLYVQRKPRGTGSVSTSIRLEGTGKSDSIRQEGRQLVPTQLAEIGNSQPYSVGIFGAIGVFVVFTGGIVLKRCIDVLVKLIIPD
jgi:hypothetical protein